MKLARQIAKYGSSTQGMPALWVHPDPDGELMIYDGVTRATRVAQLLLGTTVRVEVVEHLATTCGHLPTVGDMLP